MEHRYVKVLLIVFVGLQALVWLGNNLINWSTALGAVEYVLSQENQSGYPNHLVPAISSSLIATIVLLSILFGEALAAIFCLLGAIRMWRARRESLEAFSASKRFAILGCAAAITVWFLLFGVLGGGLLMMGQAEGVSGALEGAFRFAAYSFLALIYLSIPEHP